LFITLPLLLRLTPCDQSLDKKTKMDSTCPLLLLPHLPVFVRIQGVFLACDVVVVNFTRIDETWRSKVRSLAEKLSGTRDGCEGL
jgi:hypothetical protein